METPLVSHPADFLSGQFLKQGNVALRQGILCILAPKKVPPTASGLRGWVKSSNPSAVSVATEERILRVL